MTKSDWSQDAGYEYSMMPENGTTRILFTFPNAASGPLVFSTWLYLYKDGEIVGKNLEAEMLQCYIDRDLIERRKNHDPS